MMNEPKAAKKILRNFHASAKLHTFFVRAPKSTLVHLHRVHPYFMYPLLLSLTRYSAWGHMSIPSACAFPFPFLYSTMSPPTRRGPCTIKTTNDWRGRSSVDDYYYVEQTSKGG